MPKLRGVYPVTGCEDEGADKIRAAAGMKWVVPEVESQRWEGRILRVLQKLSVLQSQGLLPPSSAF